MGGLVLFLLFLPLISCQRCPLECECDFSPSTNETISAYCPKGGLDDVGFTSLLHSLPDTLRSLEIDAPSWRPANNFRWNDNLNRLSSLRVLRLVSCGMPSMARPRLPLLEVLDVSRNRIDHATMANFAGIANLRVLDLSHNRLSILPTGVFVYLKNLASLSLANNSISEASSNILRNLPNLKSLRLDQNRISTAQLNDLLSDVPHLESLSLSECVGGPIHGLLLHNLPSLRSLDLSGNGLKFIPSADLSSLPHLTSLSLARNRIESIPPCAFCSINLTSLDISHNKIGLRGRPLDEGAFDGTSLLSLDLGFNHLEDFDSSSIGAAQKSVKSLGLSGNFLRTFASRLTHTLTAIEELHLAHNMITALPLVFPPEYYHLKLLNLSSNHLSSLPDNLHSHLPSLTQLDLSANRFSVLSAAGAEFIDGIDRVHLAGNPWDCNCGLAQLQNHMRQSPIDCVSMGSMEGIIGHCRHALRRQLDYGDTRCSSPALLAGHPLITAHPSHDCAVLFGARYGLTQSGELLVLLGALLAAAALLAILLLLLYYGRERQYKGTYVTRECSRTPLTMSIPAHGLSCSTSSSSNGDDLHGHLSPPLPPPPPKAMSALYFGV